MDNLFVPARILLPQGVDNSRWAVMACDQFTSQPEYWDAVEKQVEGAPSTLRMILPEVYLEQPGSEKRIADIHASMRRYLDDVLQKRVEGFVYVERTLLNGSVRQGLVGCVDLEQYSYQPGANAAIRPSEGTVVERIPPRLAVRRGAPLESPHILMLVDDPDCRVVEPLAAGKQSLVPLYDVELMLDGGRLRGWAVTDGEQLGAVGDAIAALGDEKRFAQLYSTRNPSFTMAVGDGNHSLATAKAWWEEIKPGLPAAERENHPARYCLVELENIQSPAIEIEPIHRVVFGADRAAFVEAARQFAQQHGAQLAEVDEKNGEGLAEGAGATGNGARAPQGTTGGQHFVLVHGESRTGYTLTGPAKPLAVGSLETFLQHWCAQNPGARVDYVHGEGAVAQLARGDAVGVVLPALEKSDLFLGVAQGGVLPKKTFSMGHAEEKRYYMECRGIEK